MSQSVEETLNIVENASTDDEKLAALLIVAKILKDEQVDRESTTKLFKAVGFQFLHRLLKTEKTSEGCSKWTYKSVAVSVLSSFCRSKDMVSNPEMLQNLVQFNKIITDLPSLQMSHGSVCEDFSASCRVSEDPEVEEGQRVVTDTYECLSHIAAQSAGLDAFISHKTVTALCHAVANRCYGWQKAQQMLLYTVNMRGSVTWQGNLDGLQLALAHFTHLFAEAQDEYKFGICSTLYILLATTSKDQILQIQLDDWSTVLQTTLFLVLKNKLGSGQREPVLKLACTVAYLLGIEWTLAASEGDNKFLLLLVHLCCIEVRMVLESDNMEKIDEKGDLVCSCYLLLESLISYMSVCPSLQLDGKQVQQLHSAMRGAFQAVIFYLQQVQARPPQKDQAMTVASLRVLGAWIAEETSALQKEVISILPFLLQLSKKGFQSLQSTHTHEAGDGGDEETFENVLKFLLPGFCHLSSEEEARKVIIQEKGHEFLARYLSHLYTEFQQGGEEKRETEVALTTLCGVFLNFIVMETELVSTDPVFSELLSFLITSLPSLGADDLILAFNMCVMCLMLLRHHTESIQVASGVRDTMFTYVVQLLSVHELSEEDGHCYLLIKPKYQEIWSEVAELWFLGMQALNACVSLFPQLPIEILKIRWIPHITQFLLRVKDLDDMTRDSYLGLLLQLAIKGGDARQLILEHDGLRVAQLFEFALLVDCLTR